MKKYLLSLVLLGALVFSPFATSAAALTSIQVNAIVGLLQAFGADQLVINNVQAALTGTAGVSTGASSTGVSQGTSSNTDFAKLKITNSNPGASETFVTATIKGTPDNKKVYLWRLEMLCPTGVIIYGKNNENICGQTLNLYTYNMYDPTQDYLALTVGMKNNSSQSAAVVLALYAYDSLNNKLGGDKAQIFLTATGTAQPSLNIISPNGGENVAQGPQAVISWSGSQLSGVFAYLVPANSPGNGAGSLGIIGYVPSTYSYIGWDGKTVWSDLHNGTPIAVPPGSYKIYLVGNVAGASGQTVTDMSNAPFTISSGSNITPSITVAYPNGGQTWPIGMPQLIKWSYNRAPRYNETVNIAVKQACGPGQSCPGVYTVAKNISTDQISYVWNVGNPLKETIPAGSYYMSVCLATPSTGQEECDISDSYFKITDSSTTNKPPVITSLTAPSNLTVGQSGTWVVKAYDPEGSALTYTVNWGEPQLYTARSSSVGQEASFTHSYATADTYKVSITVIDNAGQAAMTSATVNVGESVSVNKPPVITSASGPMSLPTGQAGTYTVNASDPEGGPLAYRISCGNEQSDTITDPTSYLNTVNKSCTYYATGTYIVSYQVTDNASQIAKSSTMVQVSNTSSPATTPTITVTSPQPNEIWRRGNIKTIMWTTTNLGTDAYIAIRAINSAGQVIDLVRKTWNSGQVGWNVGLTADGTQLPAGFYRIRACITGPTGGCDKSSDKMLEIKEKSDGTSAGTAGAVGASSPSIWNWLGQVILGQ